MVVIEKKRIRKRNPRAKIKLAQALEISRQCLAVFGLSVEVDVYWYEFDGADIARALTIGMSSGRPRGVILLDKNLFREMPYYLCVEAIYHEAAHVVANVLYREDCGHDSRWSAVMYRFGFNEPRSQVCSTELCEEAY